MVASSRSLIWDRFLAPKLASKPWGPQLHPLQLKPILGPENGPQTGTAKESMPRVAGWSGQVFFGVRVFVVWGLGVSGFPGFRFLVLGDCGFRVFGVRAFGDRFGVGVRVSGVRVSG